MGPPFWFFPAPCQEFLHRPVGTDHKVRRTALAAGWFLTRNLLTKVEYVTQEYDGFAATDIRSGGKFNGFLIEGVIAF